MKVEAKGKLKFVDEKNDIEAEISFNNVNWKPSDFFSGDIKVKGKKSCKIYGTYMGFIEFDKVRYWDYRYVLPF